MSHIGVVAGSFDPITDGHLWLIKQASRLVDELHVVVGHNPDKKYMFTLDERLAQVRDEVSLMLTHSDCLVVVVTVSNMMLIDYATKVEATHLIRGVRSIKDYEYELTMLEFNRDMNPLIETVYFTPPPELAKVSSSFVKGLVGFDRWEERLEKYVAPGILRAIKEKKESK